MTLSYLVRSPVTATIARTNQNRRLVRYAGPSISLTIGQSSVEFVGSAMTGADGDTGRSYVHTGPFPTNAKVFVGSVNGTLRVASSKFTVTTTTTSRDTLTINLPIYDEDQVVVDI